MRWFEDGTAQEPDVLRIMRRVLFALVLLGITGLTAELLLLEHIESPTQLIPFAALFVGALVSVAFAARPGAVTLTMFRVVMLLFVASGLLGIFLHLRGNIGFEKETDPSLQGVDLLVASLSGGVPLLAPAAMAQLGLIGLAFAYRHPAARVRATPQPTSSENR